MSTKEKTQKSTSSPAIAIIQMSPLDRMCTPLQLPRASIPISSFFSRQNFPIAATFYFLLHTHTHARRVPITIVQQLVDRCLFPFGQCLCGFIHFIFNISNNHHPNICTYNNCCTFLLLSSHNYIPVIKLTIHKIRCLFDFYSIGGKVSRFSQCNVES